MARLVQCVPNFSEAQRYGVNVIGSEIVGLVPMNECSNRYCRLLFKVGKLRYFTDIREENGRVEGA